MNSGELPGLYIHFPFCRSKCLYCDFYSTASLTAIPQWLDALKHETLLYVDQFPVFDSLYLGGGTPALLDERDLAVLLDFLRRHFTFRPGSEITIEANPDGLSEQKLLSIRDAGVNRLSLGVQSLADADLRYLGRRHSAQQALEALEMVRSCGFGAMSVDLMYGLEAQTMRGWIGTLEQVLRFRPEHISCYQLTMAEGTPLWKLTQAGHIKPIGEKLERAFFIRTSRHLEKHGYVHYEISNFARSRGFMCRHNWKYWRHAPYLGLGPSAHSFRDGRRWWNVSSTGKYCQLVSQGRAPVEASETLTAEQLDLETLSLGFRTCEGIDLHRFDRIRRASAALAQMLESGLAQVKDGTIRPTRKGFLVADSLPLMFGS